MIDTPAIVETEAQLTAVIRFTIPKADIQKVMGPGMAELMAAVAAQGIAPTGPLFSHHLRMLPDSWDFEIGVPVSTPIKAAGRVEPGSLPKTAAARTVYHGPYDGLGEAWGKFCDWIAAEGLQPADDFLEYYERGPESGLDAPAYRTELVRPLAVRPKS